MISSRSFGRASLQPLLTLAALLSVISGGFILLSAYAVGSGAPAGQPANYEAFAPSGSGNEHSSSSSPWSLQSFRLEQEHGVYEVTVLSAAGRELFELALDPFSGQPLAKGQRPSTSGGLALTPQQIKASLPGLLSQLTVQQLSSSGVDGISTAPILLNGNTIATMKLDGTGGPAAPGRDAEEESDEKPGHLVRGNLVQPLGWLAAILMIAATFYYSAKRSILTAIQVAEGPQRRIIGRELRVALDRHIVAALAAVGIALLHVANFFGELGLSIGWLTLLLMLVVALSGVFGRFFGQAPVVRRRWRQFHLPLTYLFFAVLAVHILQALELLGD